MPNLLAACAVFVFGHWVLSSRGVRAALAARIGAQGFLGAYSLVALAGFVWVVLAYRSAPYLILWNPPAWTRHVPLSAMPLSLFLFAGSIGAKSPTAVGQEQALDGGGPRGFVKLTRHPMLGGFVVWGVTHLCANGDMASSVVFAAMTLLSLVGMWHIDSRRRATLGDAWREFEAQTSRLPGLALVAGRTKLEPGDLQLGRNLGLTALLYLAMLYGHRWLAGVPVVSWGA